MTMATPAAVEAEIQAIMKDRIEAVQAEDAQRLVSHHAADVVAYDLLEPLQYKGAADLRRRAQQRSTTTGASSWPAAVRRATAAG
jgi:ketosteroid isomerase-like protein